MTDSEMVKKIKVHPIGTANLVALNQPVHSRISILNDIEINAEDTEHMQLSEKVIEILDRAGYYLGYRFRHNKTGIRADILKLDLLKTIKVLKIYVVGVVGALFAFCSPILYMYVMKGERNDLLPIKYFFIDDSTLSGFFDTNFIHTLVGVFACAGTTIHGATFIAVIANYILRVDLLEQDLKDLDNMWDGRNEISVAYKRTYLINICKKQQDLIEYMNVAREIYQTKLFAYFSANYFSIIVCLFEIRKSNYLSGYGMTFSSMVAFCCIMGTQLTIASGKEIQLGPIGPLNVVTGIQVHVVTGIQILKSMYSYYTVLMQLF